VRGGAWLGRTSLARRAGTVARGISRRSLIGSALAATAAWSARAAPSPGPDALYQRAKSEGRLTWYIAHIASEEAEILGRMFTRAYPGVDVAVVRATGQVIYQKLSADLRAGAKNCDVFSSTDLGHYVTLKQRGLLAAYRPLAADTLREPFRDADPSQMTQVTNTNYTSLVYRTVAVTADEAPRRWSDLTDPKWSGRIAVGHPAYSGAMGTWVYQMNKLYGWAFFEKLARNKPQVARSLVDPTTTLVSGERDIGMGPSDLILDQAARGNPVALRVPEDGSMLQNGPTAILKDAPHPEAAKLFVEFLLGEEAGQFAASRHRLPITALVAPKPEIAAPDRIKIIVPVAQELVKGIPEVVEKWRETFGV